MAPGHSRFHPGALTADASLNRLVISPAVRDGPADVAGRLAGEVCSRDGLLELARAAGLSDLQPAWLASQLAALAVSGDRPTRRAALNTIEMFGRRLGALLATLRHPGAPVRQGDNPTRRAYLEHWLTVERIWLSGGLLSADTGRVVLRVAKPIVEAAELPCPLALVPYPALAPLVGAARLARPGSGRTAVADLGHTSIKTGVATVGDHRLLGLGRVAARAVPPPRSAHDIHTATAEALGDAAQQADGAELVVSVASYLANGRPANDGRGIYGPLAGGIDPMIAVIEARLGRRITLRFVHDGTAAAVSTGDRDRAAAVTVGTWLGVGFTPPATAALDLGPDFGIGPGV